MNESHILENTHKFVKQTLENAEAGHDYWHILRVLNNAEIIAQKEGGDLFTIRLGALLHDIADAKFHNGDESIGPKMARDFLIKQGVKQEIINEVVNIIKYISFKNSLDGNQNYGKALAIVQDADRLDAIGAIGIGRAFVYGGHKGNLMYNPHLKPVEKLDKTNYKKGETPTINHFYEKLFKLKDMMNTQTGKQMAKERHDFMKLFVKQFYDEWGNVK